MKLNKKPFIVGGHQLGDFLFFEEIPPEEVPFMLGERVLPAPLLYEKGVHMTLKRKYIPGEKVSFPQGGYEVQDNNGGIYNYDLNQVIKYPQTPKQKRTLNASMGESSGEKIKLIKVEREGPPGKKGRKPLSPEEKAIRIAEAEVRKLASGGKKGRPKGNGEKKPKNGPSGGKRGRKPLDPEVKAIREAAILAKKSGKRGRPRKP